MNILTKTKSLCPECLSFLDATIFEKNNKVWIKKNCEKHGEFLDLYFGDYDMYKRFMGFSHEGKGIENPNINESNIVCPQACGLCKMHSTHTALGNIVVTNRCDLQCWYCFFYAKKMGYVYEPSLEQIREMLRSMRKEKPVPANAIQLTGGEPTIRNDIIEIIKIAKKEGYDHIQLNTNGIRMASDPNFTTEVRKAGSNTVYLSFDGTTPKTNPKNHWEAPKILENCRKANLGIVLVPTVINSINDHDVGNILKFGIRNIDIVRAVNYQPVSLVGRITKADVRKYRITIPDVIERLEKQTDGMIVKEDFFPIPVVTPLTHLVEAITGLPKYELTTHAVCGAATYLFLDGKKVVPIPRFVDVAGLMEYLDEKAEEIKSGKGKITASLKILAKIGSFIDKDKQPKDLNLAKILFDIAIKHDYEALGELHLKTLFIGMMHFMDLWNYDIERVKRCCVHYAQPNGTIVPFCAFNVIPQWYRDAIQEKFSMPIKEWEKKVGRELQTDFYKRDIKKLEASEAYKKTYGN